MSVAFRREDDDAHREPRFELPIPPGLNLVTPRGLVLTQDRVTDLETRLAATAGEARAEIERDLRYWRTRLATAIPAPAPAEGEAGIGTRVTFTLGGATRTIGIVGQDEADPDAGLIAYDAPLARAVIGATEGERIDFGGRTDAIEILGIERL